MMYADAKNGDLFAQPTEKDQVFPDAAALQHFP
jgi:hypothetical protein